MRITVNNRYIKTKIGFLPIEWEIETLENICIKKGLIRGPFGGALKKEYFKEQGVKVYEQKNAIYKDYSLGNYYINNEKFEELKRFEVSEGDFIVSCSGTIGRIYRIPKEAEKGIINQALLNIKIDTKKINSDFFYQYFQWDNFQYRIIDNTQGGAMANLVSMEQFRKTIFPIPPLKEQAKIAEILSTWDSAIEKQEQLIEKKKEFKKGLMQRLLSGEVRFKEFNDKWKIVSLGSIFDRVTDKNNVGVTNVLTISAQNGLVNQEEYFNKSVSSKDLSGYYLLKKGDFAYNKSYSNGYPLGAIKRLNDYEEGVVSPLYICFRAKEKISTCFYEQYFESGFLNKEIFKIAQEGARNHGLLNVSVTEFFKDIKIAKPSLEEQNKIAEVLIEADKEIELLQKELEVLKLQKKGLMQRLLTGEVRVKV